MIKKIAFLTVLISLAFAAAVISAQADETTTPATTSVATSTPVVYDPVCIKNAVDKRDGAVIAAREAYHAAIIKALNDRKTALLAAYDKTNKKERVKAIKTAWAAFQKARKEANKKLRVDIPAAWRQFNADRKACKNNDDRSGQGVDLF